MKTFTYFTYFIDGEGGDGLAFTKCYVKKPYKEIVFQFDQLHELADYLVAHDDHFSSVGRDCAMNYVMYLYHNLEEAS